MEDGFLSPGTMLDAPLDSVMDFDCMDELFLDGCWLETIDGSEFLHPSPSNSTAFVDPSFVWPTLETSNGDMSASPSQKSNQEDRQRPLLPGNSPMNEPQEKSLVSTQSLCQNTVDVSGCYGQYGNNITQGSESSRRWWIGPRENAGPPTSVMQRLIWALDCIRDSTKDKDILVQLWVPVNRGGKRVLTTNNQPFWLESNCQRLANYRDISIGYHLSAEEDSKDGAGLPGRVFLGKVPEWTPDVRFFRRDEYPRINDAQRYDVRGAFAVPVFEQSSRTCFGVIEVVTTTQKIKYRPELESVCKALEAVDLRSSEVPSTQNVKASDKSYQAALPEILEVLRWACETHRLPLAQTWVACIQQGKEGCRHSAENYVRCVSTVDHACYVADPSIQGFHEACSEHHLLKGQGVAGRAFITNQPCFSTDITSIGKTEYPLSHYARLFGLCGAVAIRLRSMHTGTADFVLEFFLPVDCRDPEEQKKMLSLLSIIIQQVCRTLRVVTDKELEEEADSPVSKVIVPPESRPSGEEMLSVEHTHSERFSKENSSWPACLTEVQKSSNVVSLSKKERPKAVLGEENLECRQHREDFSLKDSVECGGDSTFGEASFSSGGTGKTAEKRYTKADKNITLEVLQQYFAGSLKDAAKSIGVCPTTLKRICRQHGVKRWPSRKIKKVGHSLQKLQRVIDSVEGASGAFRIGSFYSNFPELASQNLSGTGPFSNSKLSDQPKPSGMQPDGGTFSPPAAASQSASSSCSQSSTSSHSGSSGTQQLPSPFNASVNEDPMVGESLGDNVLKRVRSDEELHASSQEGAKPLPRSQSHKSLKEQTNWDSLKPLPENNDPVSEEVNAQRFKVRYGNEIVRLRMQNNWRFKDLLQEIAKRFNIDGISRFDVKYLDDESEWVLLTCDADLEECIDVCRSSQSHTIKLSLQVSDHHLGRSLHSSGPS